jgi:ABC-2 type transport system ATP-binding protein
MTNIINVKNLKKRYKSSESFAVNDVSFDVSEGEFFSMLGPNGAGKTTTLSILNTTLLPTQGTVKVSGYDVVTDSRKVREKIGVIFQAPSLDIKLTAEENIRFHSVLYSYIPFSFSYKNCPTRYKKRVIELSDVLGLSNDIHKPLNEFSGGMKRKLEIIIGLIHQPRILYLDEPTIGLDPITRNSLWEYLNILRKKGDTTIFLTTHYIEEAENSDHVMIINHGKIVSFGTPNELKEDLIEEYTIVSALNNEFLRQELKNLKIRFEGDGPFKIFVKENDLQIIFSKLKSKLSLIKVHNPTLEQVYLKIIGEVNHEKN